MTAALFLVFVVGVALAVIAAAAWRLPRRTTAGVAVGLMLWLGYVGVLSWSGVIADVARRPPAILAVAGPEIVSIVLAVARSRAAGRIAVAVPLELLIGFESFRIGVELFLHRLWAEGLLPRMLTYEGANVDIWIGASAPVAAWIATRGRGGLYAALAWNVAGLIALADIIVRSALTAPGPLRMLDAEVANRAIGTFPYTLIAGFLAPLAVTLHVLALRAVAARLAAPAVLKGLTA